MSTALLAPLGGSSRLWLLRRSDVRSLSWCSDRCVASSPNCRDAWLQKRRAALLKYLQLLTMSEVAVVSSDLAEFVGITENIPSLAGVGRRSSALHAAQCVLGQPGNQRDRSHPLLHLSPPRWCALVSVTGVSSISTAGGKVEEGADDGFWDPSPLFDAARRGDLEAVKAAVMGGINVNAVQEVRRAQLCAMCRRSPRCLRPRA